MKNQLLYPLVILAAFCTTSFASSTTLNGVYIERLMMDTNHGDYLFIDLNQHQSVPATCHTNNSWEFVLDLRTQKGEHFYSLMLAAHMANRPILLTGTDNCTLYPQIEDLRRIELLD